jgi:hypothetical protein
VGASLGVSTGAAGAAPFVEASAGAGCAVVSLSGAFSAPSSGDAFAAGFGAGFGAAFLAAPLSADAFSSSPNWSVNLFTTGGSTVDDADLTNSPISLSLVRTTLLSTPSSLASSWTRTLATLLLLVRVPVPAVREGGVGPLAGVHAHRKVLIECS